MIHYTAHLYIGRALSTDRAQPFNHQTGAFYHRARVSPPKLPIQVLSAGQLKGYIGGKCDSWPEAEQGAGAGALTAGDTRFFFSAIR